MNYEPPVSLDEAWGESWQDYRDKHQHSGTKSAPPWSKEFHQDSPSTNNNQRNAHRGGQPALADDCGDGLIYSPRPPRRPVPRHYYDTLKNEVPSYYPRPQSHHSQIAAPPSVLNVPRVSQSIPGSHLGYSTPFYPQVPLAQTPFIAQPYYMNGFAPPQPFSGVGDPRASPNESPGHGRVPGEENDEADVTEGEDQVENRESETKEAPKDLLEDRENQDGTERKQSKKTRSTNSPKKHTKSRTDNVDIATKVREQKELIRDIVMGLLIVLVVVVLCVSGAALTKLTQIEKQMNFLSNWSLITQHNRPSPYSSPLHPPPLSPSTLW